MQKINNRKKKESRFEKILGIITATGFGIVIALLLLEFFFIG